MVDYATFFGIVQREASDKGLGGPGSSSSRTNLTAQIGEYWTENEAQVRSWSESQAREWARENVTV